MLHKQTVANVHCMGFKSNIYSIVAGVALVALVAVSVQEVRSCYMLPKAIDINAPALHIYR